MENAIALRPSADAATYAHDPALIIAKSPEEMETARMRLLAWFQSKLDVVIRERDEAKENHTHAVAHKWKSEPFKRMELKAAKLVTFYEKIISAIQAGYFIIPSFPITTFAIRTKNKKPKSAIFTGNYQWEANRRAFEDQKPDILPEGKGEYKNPVPRIKTYSRKKTDPQTNKEVIEHQAWPSEWNEMEIPLQAAVPVLMKSLGAVMKRKIFDEIGMCPPKRRPDPMLIGKIKHPHSKYGERDLHFLIGWWMRFEDLP